MISYITHTQSLDHDAALTSKKIHPSSPPDTARKLIRSGDPGSSLHFLSIRQLDGDGLAVGCLLGQIGVTLLLQSLIELQALRDISRPRVQLIRDKTHALKYSNTNSSIHG